MPMVNARSEKLTDQSGPHAAELIRSSAFLSWIQESLQAGQHVMATSNQGTLLHYQRDGFDWVVKAAMGPPPLRWLRARALRHEHAAYQRLEGVSGIPECIGLVADQYLVLERVEGTPYRHARIDHRQAWFSELLEIIKAMHDQGVSHRDLKRKANLLVTADQQPCVLDFGACFLLKSGWAPLNHRLFEWWKRTDLNAWVKHKYHGDYAAVSEEDQQYLNYSRVEAFLRRRRQAGAERASRSGDR